MSNKWDGYVKVEGLPQAVKVRGLKFLNRALHLDTVVVKLVNWVIWEKAQNQLTKAIDFDEVADGDPYQTASKEEKQPAKDEENEDTTTRQESSD